MCVAQGLPRHGDCLCSGWQDSTQAARRPQTSPQVTPHPSDQEHPPSSLWHLQASPTHFHPGGPARPGQGTELAKAGARQGRPGPLLFPAVGGALLPPAGTPWPALQGPQAGTGLQDA